MIKGHITKDVMILVISMKRVRNMMIIDMREEINERVKIIEASTKLITSLKDVKVNTIRMTITSISQCRVPMIIKEMLVRVNKCRFNPSCKQMYQPLLF